MALVSFREKLSAQDRELARVSLVDEICRKILARHSGARASCEDVDPALFTQMCCLREGYMLECPLSLAAMYLPGLARTMLERGADFRRATLGGASVLFSVCLGAVLAVSRHGARELFNDLLARGADPAEPVAWELRKARPPYNRSLLAYLIGRGRAGLPFIKRLYADPHFDGLVWASTEDPPLTAEEYAAAQPGGLSPGLARLLGRAARWSPERRAWVGAVLRALAAKRQP